MQIGRRGCFARRPETARSAQVAFSPRRRARFQTYILAVFCSFRFYVVIGALPAPCLHQNELFASTACTFSKHVILMIFVNIQPYVVIGASGLMRATLVRQSGSHKPLLRPRRTSQRTVVIGGRPAPLLPQIVFVPSTACTFSKRVFLMVFVKPQPYLVIRVRPAPLFDQYGRLASTACTFLRRLIVFGCYLENCVPLKREAPFGSPGLSP